MSNVDSSPSPSRFRQTVWGLVKLGAALALLGYLVNRAWQSDQFDVLSSGNVRWDRFGLGCLCTLIAIVITFERWYWLTSELGFSISRWQAYRLGFAGYLLNFVTVGTVGGDAFRAIALASRDRTRASQAVASVIYDRAVGLVALFILSAVALFLLDLEAISGGDPVRRGVLEAARGTAAVAGTVGVGVLALLALLPKTRMETLVQRLTSLRGVGRAAGPVAMAMLAFAGYRRAMLLSLASSIPVHVVNALAVVAVASALPIERPSLMAHLGTVPLAHLAGVLPLPGGIGAFEGALGWLYEAVAESEEAGRYGLLVAFGVRFTMLIVAALGMISYAFERK